MTEKPLLPTNTSPGQSGHAKQHLSLLVLISANIASSVSLILLNKNLMVNHKFHFLLFLSSCHFLATVIFSRVSAQLEVFKPKRSAMPVSVLATMALAGTCSIVFMNYNLSFNSVGFYQMTKLLCIPYMVFHGRYFMAQKVSREMAFALVLILGGVGVVTVTDLSVNAAGLVFGLLAVISTAQFQIWQGSKQSEYKLNPMQITDAVMPFQFLCCFFMSLLLETGVLSRVFDSAQTSQSITNVEWSSDLIWAIALTCFGAIAVNILTYALIGKTSAITFQVIGHLKTILTIAGGMYLFSSEARSTSQYLWNLFGIGIAMFGMVLYGDIKNNSATHSTIMCRLTGSIAFWTREY